MNGKRKGRLLCAGALALAFVIWTVLTRYALVAPIGPRGSQVGLAPLNKLFHNLTGVHLWLYTITDWLGLVPIAVALCFAVYGLVEWIRRGSIRLVDRDILLLGGFYIAVCSLYMLFEYVVVNYRPVLIAGHLEPSYPSSTTLLVASVMPTAYRVLARRARKRWLRCLLCTVIYAFTCFMVVGRLLSGVHWLTDIIGGLLLSAALVTAYAAPVNE